MAEIISEYKGMFIKTILKYEVLSRKKKKTFYSFNTEQEARNYIESAIVYEREMTKRFDKMYNKGEKDSVQVY